MVGARCFGFISGDWIHCTREDQSAGCEFHASSNTYSHRLRGPCKCGVEHSPGDPPNGKARKKGIDRIYQYRDASGNVVHETIRYRNPKTFSQRRPDGKGGYIWKDVFAGITPVLYNLPAILAADVDRPVWIVEGEKDVDNLTAQGRLATTNPMGAGKWRDHYAEVLRDRHCILVPDNDPPEKKYPEGKGRDHVQKVARSLHGKAASVKILDLVKHMPDLPVKGDASDFLDRGGTVDRLDELARKTEEWKPSAEPVSKPASSPERHANFRARIVREIVRHDAGETTRHYEIEAIHDDGSVQMATVAAKDFESMSWVSDQLGLKFAIWTGHGMKDRFQHYIRVNSYRNPVDVREVFTSLGWHVVGGKDVYLHAGGAIGSNGKTDVRVDVSSELALYRLPVPDLSRLKEGTERFSQCSTIWEPMQSRSHRS